MNCVRNNLPCLAAALIGASILALPTQARADFEARYSLNGGAFQTIGSTNSNPGEITGSIDGINVDATSHDLLNAQLSKLDLGINGILNTNITSLVVQASVTDVPTLPPPQTLTWQATSSSDVGVIETIQGWVNTSDLLYATTGPTTTGPQSGVSSGAVGFSYASTYSWTIQYSIGAEASGTAFSEDDKQDVIASPTPAGLVLVLAGMPILGLGMWLRRRGSLAQVA